MSLSKAYSNISLSGHWDNSGEMLHALLKAGFRLERNPFLLTNESVPAEYSKIVHLAAISDKADLLNEQFTWLAWLRTNDPALTLKAYQAGARAVFPPETPPELLVQALLQMVENPSQAVNGDLQRRYQRNDLIFLENDSVLEIIEGVVATMMVHKDGTQVLLGLSGPGQILVAHPDDECYIQFLAHTPAAVSIQRWEQAVGMSDFPEKLRARLQQMEGWAAMQARPYLDQQILGILGLLAEQFGKPCEQGILIDVRITHSNLAVALGATRTTITRVLGELRASGKLISIETGSGDYFCLCGENAHIHHHG
jgi:hypothetical protein